MASVGAFSSISIFVPSVRSYGKAASGAPAPTGTGSSTKFTLTSMPVSVGFTRRSFDTLEASAARMYDAAIEPALQQGETDGTETSSYSPRQPNAFSGVNEDGTYIPQAQSSASRPAAAEPQAKANPAAVTTAMRMYAAVCAEYRQMTVPGGYLMRVNAWLSTRPTISIVA